MADGGTCEHELCVCPATDDSEYCSDHCSNAADEEMIVTACGCGHPGCEAS